MWRDVAASAAGFAAVAIVFTWPLAVRAGSALTAQPFGDPVLNAWILAWNADRALHGFEGYWTAPFFYPWPDTLAYSEHLFGVALFTAPVQWLTGNPALAYNFALLGSTVLAGTGMYLLALHASGRRDAACIAAVAFACSPYRVPQVSHLQVLFWGWMPIALWGLHSYFSDESSDEPIAAARRRRKWLLVFVAAFLLQALSNGYFLYFQAVPVAIIAVHGLWRARSHLRLQLLELAAAGAVILAGLLPFVLAYLRVRRTQGLTRSFADIVHFSPDLRAWGHVDARLWFWGRILPAGDYEAELFPGVVIVFLAAAAIVAAVIRRNAAGAMERRCRSWVWLYSAVLAGGVLLVLGPRPRLFGWQLPVAGPYAWLMALVPGLDGLRVPARMAVVVYLSLAMLGALGAAGVLARLQSRRAWIAAAALASLVALEGYAGPLALERFPTPHMAADRAAYQWLRSQPPGPMLELPVKDHRLATRYLYRTLEHPHRILNGYSGYGSLLEELVGGPPFAEIDGFGEAFEMLRAIGIRWVLVHRAIYRDPVQGDAITRAAMSQTPHVTRAVDFGTAVALELRPLAGPPPPAAAGWPLVPPSAIQLSASHNPDRLPLAVDGDRATRWLTGEAQTGREWIELRFDRPRNLARLRIEMDRRSLGDYPRALAIEGSSDGTQFEALTNASALVALGVSVAREPATPAVDLALPPNETRVLRLRVKGRAHRAFWSVPEIAVYERRPQ